MLDYQKEINNYCKILKMPAIRKTFKEQISDKISFEEYLYNLLKLEFESREENAKQNKLKLAKRAGRKSIVITINLSFERWNEIFKNPVLTAAMIDRLTHKAYIVNMNGNSYRLKGTQNMLEENE